MLGIDFGPFSTLYETLNKVLPGEVWMYLAAAALALVAIAIWHQIVG